MIRADLQEKIDKSVKSLKLAAEMSKEFYKAPLVIAYSGGKDSDVLLNLAESCLTPDEFEVQHSLTTVDAPPTIKHIKKQFKRLEEKGIEASIDYHEYEDENGVKRRHTMWRLIEQKGIAPTRIARYCCQVLKESSTPNRIAVLGVRGGESAKRAGRDIFGVRGGSYRKATFFSLDHTEEVFEESKSRDPVWDCKLIEIMRKKGDTVVSPIYEWSDEDIWNYIHEMGIETNPLYQMGFKRVGCVGCPMASYKGKMMEFELFPTYKQAYIHAFDRMLKTLRERQKKDGKRREIEWKNGQEVFDWWIGKDKLQCKGQMTLEDFDDTDTT